MTNNIEKLYELAKVKKEYYSFKTEKEEFTWELDENGNDKHNCIFCGEPEIKIRHFTPAKQLKLILLICDNSKRDYYAYFSCDKDEIDNLYYLNFVKNEEKCSKNKTIKNIDFSQALAGLVCELWEDLTDEQREGVRGILE